jgi:hypothetical protein
MKHLYFRFSLKIRAMGGAAQPKDVKSVVRLDEEGSSFYKKQVRRRISYA